MIEEKIIEGNKLIAEFMGGKYDKDTNFPIHPNDIWLPIHGITNYTTINMGCGKILLYHSSWDWLLPVVEKILGTENNSSDWEKHYTQIHDSLWLINIESVWLSVVEFIKWYNQNKND